VVPARTNSERFGCAWLAAGDEWRTDRRASLGRVRADPSTSTICWTRAASFFRFLLCHRRPPSTAPEIPKRRSPFYKPKFSRSRRIFFCLMKDQRDQPARREQRGPRAFKASWVRLARSVYREYKAFRALRRRSKASSPSSSRPYRAWGLFSVLRDQQVSRESQVSPEHPPHRNSRSSPNSSRVFSATASRPLRSPCGPSNECPPGDPSTSPSPSDPSTIRRERFDRLFLPLQSFPFLQLFPLGGLPLARDLSTPPGSSRKRCSGGEINGDCSASRFERNAEQLTWLARELAQLNHKRTPYLRS